MSSRASISAIGVVIVGASLASRTGFANGAPAPDDPVAWLATRAELRPLDRIAVVAGDGADPEAGWARDAVARVLAGAGHDVATLAGRGVSTDREKLVSACRGFDALAVVRNSTAGDRPAITVTLYGPQGDLLAALDGPGLPAPAWPPRAPPTEAPTPRLALDPGHLHGPAFYEAIGRPDLAASYRHRRTAKIVMLSAGGGIVVAGVALAALDALATAVNNYRPFAFLAPEASSGQMAPQAQTSDWPWMVVGLGAATLMGGAVLPSDPLSLTDKQRQALYQGVAAPPREPERAPRQDRSRGAGLQLGLVPAARGEGGSLILGGRF